MDQHQRQMTRLQTESMDQPNNTIRNAVRAVIIKNGKLLLLKKYSDLYGDRYSLPGGAQETRETLHEALIRECLEEIDCIVEVGDIHYVADFFKEKLTPQPHTRHQVEFLFQCSVPETYTPRNGVKPDKHQLNVVWVPLQELAGLSLSPLFLVDLFTNENSLTKSVYLGAIA